MVKGENKDAEHFLALLEQRVVVEAVRHDHLVAGVNILTRKLLQILRALPGL